MKLRIKVTKAILEKSKMCSGASYSSNCAIALACRKIFPNCRVGALYIRPLDSFKDPHGSFDILLPKVASDFIMKFDGLKPEDRVKLPELEFEVELSEALINEINIEEVSKTLENSSTLKLIES